MTSLIGFFFRQHLFGNLLTVLVLLTGLYSVFTIRKDLFPKVNFDITIVTATFPGASPDQVERLVINPLEQALKEVDGLKKVQSQALDNLAIITVTLDPDARDPDKTNDDIQRAVDRVEDYPADAERPVVMVLESGQTPVIELSITSESVDEMTLRRIAKDVADELSNVPGVAKVVKDGWRKREYQIWADQSLLIRDQISLSGIVDAIAGQNFQLPAGDMTLPTGKEIAVKTDGEFKDLTGIENTFVRANFEGFGVRIGDVADIKEGLEKPSLIYRTNGKPSFKFTLLKKERADALKTVESIRARMEELKSRFPAGVEYSFVNDFTFYLEQRLSTLSGNMAFGIALVLLVLALFLPFRVAAVVAIGIPFSMMLAITVIQYYGYSLNLVSLIGLIIVSGMLVDDTVVVTENIFRRIESGEELRKAILDGATEMITPVTASILTTIGAFAPMLFMSGIFGKFIFEIPLLVILPLAISLFEAFLIAPAHILTIVGTTAHRKIAEAKASAAKAHWYDRLLPHYRALVRRTVEHRYKALAGFAALIIFTGVLTTQMRFILFPPEGIYSFFVRIDGQPGATLHEMTKVIAQVEPFISSLPEGELIDYTSMIGIQQNEPNDPLTKRAPHYSQILVNLTPDNARERSVDQIVEALREKIVLPEGAVKLGFEVAKGGPPQGRPISINIYGEDFKVLRRLAGEIKETMKTVPGVQDIEDSEVLGKREIKITPDSSQLGRLGLSAREVATTVRAAFAGVVASSSRTLDEEIDIRVLLKPPPKQAAQQLDSIRIGTREGHLIPLTKIAAFEESDSRLIIQHEKYKRILNVSAQVNLEETTAIAATKELEKKLKDLLKNDPRYEISFAGENEDTEESMASLGRAFAVAALVIFMILVLTFGSFIQPVLVLMALPLGFIGVVFALLLHGKPLSFMAMLGIIALAGVIVNNAIVYIDFFNSRRREGVPLTEALVDAASTRLRPILLTSLTTVLGLMPTAYGLSGSDGFVAALALALGWGLMIGSALTALFFPAMLCAVEDAKGLGSRLWRRVFASY